MPRLRVLLVCRSRFSGVCWPVLRAVRADCEPAAASPQRECSWAAEPGVPVAICGLQLGSHIWPGRWHWASTGCCGVPRPAQHPAPPVLQGTAQQSSRSRPCRLLRGARHSLALLLQLSPASFHLVPKKGIKPEEALPSTYVAQSPLNLMNQQSSCLYPDWHKAAATEPAVDLYF